MEDDTDWLIGYYAPKHSCIIKKWRITPLNHDPYKVAATSAFKLAWGDMDMLSMNLLHVLYIMLFGEFKQSLPPQVSYHSQKPIYWGNPAKWLKNLNVPKQQ